MPRQTISVRGARAYNAGKRGDYYYPDLTIDAPGSSDAAKRWIDGMMQAELIEAEFTSLDGDAGHLSGVSPDLVLPPSVEWAGGIVRPPSGDKIISVQATRTIPSDAAVPELPEIYGRSIWFTSGIGINNHLRGGGMLYAYVGNWIEVDKNGHATRVFASGPWFLWGRSTYFAHAFPKTNPGGHSVLLDSEPVEPEPGDPQRHSRLSQFHAEQGDARLDNESSHRRCARRRPS